MTQLERLIKAVACYFSLFDYPLTAFEIHKWLGSRETVSPAQVNAALNQITKADQTVGLAEKDGLYFLPGRADTVAKRLQKYFDNQRKVARARRAARLISWLPFWRLVAVVNTAAADNSAPESDIDWLIVAKKGRLWTTRFLITAWLFLFGRWRHGRQVSDRICLSFFLADDALNLECLRLPQGDIYLTYWMTQLVPLLAHKDTLNHFLESNSWVKNELANWDTRYLLHDRRGLETGAVTQLIRGQLEKILSGKLGETMEKFLRRLQFSKIAKREASRPSRETPNAVVISDQMLKFHEIDRRAEFHRRWIELISP